MSDPATDLTDPLSAAMSVARIVAGAGGRALIVGGWVRDRLLGLPSKDIDLEVFGLEPDALARLLETIGPVNTVGESFTVYKVASLDVAIPRRESKIGRGHRGFEVTGDPFMSFEEAARRRDFTINAIAWDPLRAEYLDPFHGADDLSARRLRMVDPATFADDSLRVLRALQFAARFDATLEPATFEVCRTIPLDDLPAERVWGEVEKLLLKARRPSIGFALGRELGIVDRLFPEMAILAGCPQEPEWHPEGDVWTHTLLVIDRASERLDGLDHPRAISVMLAAIAHDFGKPATTAVIDGRIRSLGHEEAGVAPTLSFLDRLNVHTLGGYDVRRQVTALVAHHLKPGMWHKAPQVGDAAFRRLAARVDLELLARLSDADCLGRTGVFDCAASSWFLERARALGVENRPPPPLLLGRHVVALGIPPGPQVGRILKAVYDAQMEGELTTVDEAVERARQLIAAG